MSRPHPADRWRRIVRVGAGAAVVAGFIIVRRRGSRIMYAVRSSP